MRENISFVPTRQLTVPVLFLIYKRLDTTKKVFEMIRRVKPRKLYIASDGPRDGVSGEKEAVETVRVYVLSEIDWDCDVKTLFRERNLGCRYAVSSAITWFFNHEELGIILEDDTVPSMSFFYFCEELLKKYQHETRIWHIGGTSFVDYPDLVENDYFFSIFPICWGWATWADRWAKYDVDLNFLDERSFHKVLTEMFDESKAIKHWMRIYKIIKSGKDNTWDYQWMFTIWYYKGIAILPKYNMISNIGFGPEATHFVPNPDMINRKRNEFEIKNHPEKIEVNKLADMYMYKHYLGPIPLKRRIINKIKKILKTYK